MTEYCPICSKECDTVASLIGHLKTKQDADHEGEFVERAISFYEEQLDIFEEVPA